MKECIFCDEIGKENNGVWKIIIFRRFRGSYGKKSSPICHDCLSDALTGYHTGGGLVGSVIKKIKRVDRDEFYKYRTSFIRWIIERIRHYRYVRYLMHGNRESRRRDRNESLL